MTMPGDGSPADPSAEAAREREWKAYLARKEQARKRQGEKRFAEHRRSVRQRASPAAAIAVIAMGLVVAVCWALAALSGLSRC